MNSLAQTIASDLGALRDVEGVAVVEQGGGVRISGTAKTPVGKFKFSINMPPPISPLAAVSRVRKLCKTGE